MTGVLTLAETVASVRASAPLCLGGPMSLSVVGAESNAAIRPCKTRPHREKGGRVGANKLGALILRTLRAEGVGSTRRGSPRTAY
jgi:2-dehydro-3-deoxygluconokinase